MQNQPYVRRDQWRVFNGTGDLGDPEALRREVAPDRPRALRPCPEVADCLSRRSLCPLLDPPCLSDCRAAAEQRRSGKRWRRAALLAIGLASSAFFLWLVFRDADLDAVWRALRGADVGLVLLAVVVIQFVYVAQAARWRRIAGTLELTVRRFYALVLGGLGANDVLPLRIGDLLRARWLATSAEIPTGRAFGSVFRDRACDVLTLVVALIVSLPFIGGAAWVARIAVGGIVLLGDPRARRRRGDRLRAEAAARPPRAPQPARGGCCATRSTSSPRRSAGARS